MDGIPVIRITVSRVFFVQRKLFSPHSQNRLYKAFLLLMWLLRHINLTFCIHASMNRCQICMALNSCKILFTDVIFSYIINYTCIIFEKA